MSLELNKLAASVLTAGVVAMGTGFIADVLMHPHVPEEPHYSVAAREDTGDGEQKPKGPEPVLPLLASADASAGESATRACQACHSFEKGGPNKVGPNLYGVVGDPIAGVEGFSYSQALQDKDGAWTYQAINAFLYDPQGWAPGTKMSYSGVKDAKKRADIVAYLRENDDSPEPLPTEEEIAQVTAGEEEAAPADEPGMAAADEKAPADGAAGSLAQRLQAASAADGEKAARACQACHSFDEGGPNKVGPNLYDVVGAEIAAAEGFSYSSALEGKEGAWTYEMLDAFLENPQGWAKGTRMTYPGVKDPKKRADVIAYLRQQGSNPPPLPAAGDGEVAEKAEAAEEPAETQEAAAPEDAQPEAPAEPEQAPEAAEAADAVDGGDTIAAKIRAANADDGKKAAAICQACHSFDKGGPHKVGPNLYNVVGSDIASAEGYSFSDALKKKEGAWTYDRLDAFLENPQGWAKGTRMAYPGVKNPDKRADVIAYLRQQADEAPPLD